MENEGNPEGMIQKKAYKEFIIPKLSSRMIAQSRIIAEASEFVRCSDWFLFMAVNRRDGRKKQPPF